MASKFVVDPSSPDEEAVFPQKSVTCPWLDLSEEELQKKVDGECEEAAKHIWDPDGHSNTIYLKEGFRTIHRRPVGNSSDCCRAKIGFSEGLHVWELLWPTNRGSCACAGVGIPGTRLHRGDGYYPVLGMDDKSWAWNLCTLELQHDGMSGVHYPADISLLGVDPPVGRGYCTETLTLRIVLDMDVGTLGFELGGRYLGPAFCNLNCEMQKLYPMISAVFGDTNITLTYLGQFSRGPRRLRDICRTVILKTLKKKTARQSVKALPLPTPMKTFLMAPLL